jgi:hypothetical protein
LQKYAEVCNDNEVDHGIEDLELFFVAKRQMNEAMAFVYLSGLLEEVEYDYNFNGNS